MPSLPCRSILAGAACCLALVACDTHEYPVVRPFVESDDLVVITVNSPDTYYENADGRIAGLEFDLVSEFARDLGMQVKFRTVPGLDQMLATLQRQGGHLAAGLVVGARHAVHARLGPEYQRVQPQVAYNTDRGRVTDALQLVGRSVVIASGTPYAEPLAKVLQQAPGLKWAEVDIPGEDLLAKLAKGEEGVDYVVADSVQIARARSFYPNLDVAFDLGAPAGKAWLFPLYAERALLEKAQAFFERIERDGTLGHLLDRHYGHIGRLERTDVSGILARRRTQLPDLRAHFHEAEEVAGIDWRLIAALAYQESAWDHLATSPANVRGIMMLTEATADRMKVADRLDARESILAGARYLRLLMDRLPTRILEPDRTWIALAAYNQGPSHIEDARILAQRLGLNPDSWADVKKVLPLLSLSGYFQTLRHGYARGGEAVVLTESVRTYYSILLKYERPYSWGFPVVKEVAPAA
ncbi:membrane-bound lytic murein transglycosylase MltF [Nitrosovibrio sp. Nv17]|uniref:membrane-bound lytic murein transglycosylase MltF n=1 Tax=Nitrosovibrio sp. Nv17 TaxID=1855339 RepID=UPI000908E593|nr:membrane-bound lytic murein transglycosylase MltF [Nitrosovibrio sp. Nv17]SFW36577.1 membrane-bound lytic murein transglycosylase F [Nitrosovibrio sp. Nv17]